MAKNSKKTEVINFRLTALEDRMIRMAAELKGQNANKSDYIRDSALKQAEIDLANKNQYSVSETEMTQLLAALESPAVKHDELSKLLKEKSILE